MQGTQNKQEINCQYRVPNAVEIEIHVVESGIVLKVRGLALIEWGVKLEAWRLGVADAQHHLDLRLPAHGERRHQGQQVLHWLEVIRTHTRLTTGVSQQERGGGDGDDSDREKIVDIDISIYNFNRF